MDKTQVVRLTSDHLYIGIIEFAYDQPTIDGHFQRDWQLFSVSLL